MTLAVKLDENLSRSFERALRGAARELRTVQQEVLGGAHDSMWPPRPGGRIASW